MATTSHGIKDREAEPGGLGTSTNPLIQSAETPVYFDPQQGLFVTQWVPGCTEVREIKRQP